jgi:membrane-bound lytic murein transglycosylase D
MGAIRLALLSLSLAGCASVAPDPRGAVPATGPAATSSSAAPSTARTAPTPSAPGATVAAPARAATAATPDAMSALLQTVPGAVGAESSTAPAPPADIWVRIRRGFAMPDLDTPLVEQRTRWYASQPDYLQRMMRRSSRYLYYIVEQIESRGMPTELALLPFVESAFQPEAMSSAKAAGLWQFIPSTGKDFDLAQNHWKDERRDVVESTRAALDYLQKLHDQFGDWQLALAAYNWGEGSVGRAIERNRRAGLGTSYVDLRMPLETQHYVPKLQAIKNIVADPARYSVALPAVVNEPYFVQVHPTRDMDVRTAARLAGMKLEDFTALNPAHNRPVIPAAHNTPILLPADKVDAFTANLAAWEATGQPLASWTTYKLANGETLAVVARRAGISEAQLRDANRVPARYKPTPGSTLLIPRDESMDADISAASLAGQFVLVPEQQMRRITYRVRKGDTVQSVAARYKLAPQDVIRWNGLTKNALFAGQRLALEVPAAATRSGTSTAKAAPGKPAQSAGAKSAAPKPAAASKPRSGSAKTASPKSGATRKTAVAASQR